MLIYQGCERLDDIDKNHSRLIIRVLRKSDFLDKRYFIFLRKIFDSTIHLYILVSNRLIHYMLDNV